MFIFFGSRRTVKDLGSYPVSGTCPNCHNTINLKIIKVTDWFTLYFIPIFPLKVERFKTCPICSIAQKISKEEAEQLLGEE